MTREEAIKIIQDCKEKGFKHRFYTVNEYAALDMAIKALRNEDTFLDKVLEIIDAEMDEVNCIEPKYWLSLNKMRGKVLDLKRRPLY